jgi:hypothetical protein
MRCKDKIAVVIAVGIAAMLAASASTALADSKVYVAKKFPEDVPCEAFRRDDKGIWHLREGIVIDTGPLKITLWSRTINTDEGKAMQARCGKS